MDTGGRSRMAREEADETEQNEKQTLHKYNMIANKNI